MSLNRDSRPAAVLRVGLIFSRTLLRESISCLLEQEAFQFEGGFDSVEEALAAYSRADSLPDLIILGWDSPSVSIHTVHGLVQSLPDVAVVVLAGIQMPYDDNAVREMVEAGASGCLSADLSTPEFVHSLHLLARGDLVVSREVARVGRDASGEGDPMPSPSNLTQRERQVLKFVANGDTNKEIAKTLVVTESTVKAHLNHILNKLDLRNRQQVAAYAIRHALVPHQLDAENDRDVEP